MRWRERDGVRWLEAELPGARAVFSSRLGGVSEPPYDALNLGRSTGDPGVRENRLRLAWALGVEPDHVLTARQVHGTEVLDDREPGQPGAYLDPRPEAPTADGHVTARRGYAPMVLVADCLPVALVGEGSIAMVHCGWRGLAGGIVERGVDAAGATQAVIGPGIGPCCYEVGEEVLAQFEPLGPGVADGSMLDIRAVAGRLLERAGIERIEVIELCTSCNPGLFFSHRRDGDRAGRQAGLILADD
jgi:purine-nucleoside/S-methyl-5'-thioadenosine phosphorylase / adenosine deaminase